MQNDALSWKQLDSCGPGSATFGIQPWSNTGKARLLPPGGLREKGQRAAAAGFKGQAWHGVGGSLPGILFFPCTKPCANHPWSWPSRCEMVKECLSWQHVLGTCLLTATSPLHQPTLALLPPSDSARLGAVTIHVPLRACEFPSSFQRAGFERERGKGEGIRALGP